MVEFLIENNELKKKIDQVCKNGQQHLVENKKYAQKIVVGSKESSLLSETYGIYECFTANWPNQTTEEDVKVFFSEFSTIEEFPASGGFTGGYTNGPASTINGTASSAWNGSAYNSNNPSSATRPSGSKPSGSIKIWNF
ncbi:unnamed protein product [Brachionus calyciflorus]|uniref:Uncharacterized protein n=1 Tax=Brachionus calyciflorus TaxID=104777 RepID=A0A814GBB8_9BILA|nr:unnamed protein product [Brachionus calyciflorus]